MPISEKYHCIFVHIPKCAGTSIEAALGMHGDNELIGLKPNLNQQKNLETLFGAGLQHFSAMEICNHIGTDAFDAMFKFSFVRNPWDRFISHVAWKADHSGKLKWYRQAAPSMKEFYQTLWSLSVSKILNRPVHDHLRSQSSFIYDRGRVMVDFVGKIETIEADWAAICQKLGINIQLERRMRSEHNPYRTYYNSITKLIIQFIYREDIKRFGYQF